MTPRTLITAFLLSTLAACTEPPAPVANEHEPVPVSTAECKPSVYPFWTKFREAVLKENWDVMADMTEFPFDVYERNGKKSHLSREEFIRRLPEFLSLEPYYGYSGVEPKPASMKALIRAIPALATDACGDFTNQMTIDLWSFGITAEGWRFGRVDVPGPQYRR